MAKKRNNGRSVLAGDLQGSGTGCVVKTGEGALFPLNADCPFKATIEHYEGNVVTKREIVTVTARTIDALTITRATQTCVQDDSVDPRTRTQNALSFVAGDVIRQTLTEDEWNDLETEVYVNIEANKLSKTGGTMTGALIEARSPSIASATTTDLSSLDGNSAHITGTTTITSFGTVLDGARFTLVFDGALLLTHHSVNLILPTGANITTAVGDTMEVLGDNTGWRVVDYQRKDGTPLSMFSISNIENDFTAGEDMVAGKGFRKGDATIFVEQIPYTEKVTQSTGGGADSGNALGIASEFIQGQGITFSGASTIHNVSVYLKKNLSPTFVLSCRIYSDAALTTLVATATNTLTSSTVATSYTKYTFTFSGESVPAVFYIALYPLTVDSGSNYLRADYVGTNPYAGGNKFSANSGISVSQQTGSDLKILVNEGGVDVYEDVTKQYTAKAISTTYNKVKGTVKNNTTKNSLFKGNLGGEQSGYSSLTEGEVYFLKDDGTIGTTAGTTSVKMGRALSTTKLNFVPPL